MLARPDVPDARERAGAAAAARARGVDRAAALVGARAGRPGAARRARAADGVAVDDPQRGRVRPLHPGLDPARLRAGRHLQRPGAARQGEPGLVARDLPHPRVPATSTRASSTTPEPEIEDILRARSKAYIRKHPTYVAKVAEWTTLRMFELGGLDWSRHTASTISVDRGLGERRRRSASGCSRCWRSRARSRRRARRTPLFVWLVPVLLYLSVVFLVVETPRYRTGIDPFIVMLAALALRRALPGAGDREPPPPDRARYPTSPTAPTPA